MALKPLLSFSSGELDPILHDNVTLEKFNKGLATARNVIVSKTGSLLSRFSRAQFKTTKNTTDPVRLYFSKGNNVLLEFGDSYVRGYFLNNLSVPFAECPHSFTSDDLPNMHFATSGVYVYVFVANKTTFKVRIDPSFFLLPIPSSEIFEVTNAPANGAITPAGTPSGYAVDYAVTYVINGEETLPVEISLVGAQKPITSSQSNKIFVDWEDTTPLYGVTKIPTQMRVYSRPREGAAYGFLGSGIITYNGGTLRYEGEYIDFGGEPDYTNGLPEIVTKYGNLENEIIDLKPRTGVIYQQRLLLNPNSLAESIIASRPGYQNNFYRDFPYGADSALLFKSGSEGNAYVLRMVESEGLVVFTTSGVFTSVGLLSINNLALDKKGSWVINEKIPPLIVPGGLFFVDRSNVIRQFVFSQEINSYESVEQTIFSNHIFQKRVISSWAYQSGSVPLIIVSFTDGTFATFTYNYEHQMKAWTRSDSKYFVEQVEGTDIIDTTFFLTNKNGERYIEVSLPRRVPPSEYVENPESDKINLNAFMDGIKTTYWKLQDYVYNGNTYHEISVTPVTLGVWDGQLNLSATNPIPDGAFLNYVVGDILRFFHPITKNAIDLEIIIKTDDSNITVQPSEEFPSQYASNPNIYATFNVITGLDHLEGESVAVMSDGGIVASPNNDVEIYPILTVTGGQITLPNNLRGSFVIVGRPIVADVKTLNLTTIEQSPTMIESLTVNKLYLRLNESRGLYCSNKFPEEYVNEVDGSSVEGMDDVYEVDVYNNLIIGNKALPPITKRIEKIIPGGWDSQGQISLRQVDPYHFEILSIIPDVEIFARSNR